jgi:hypothetical protein
LLGFDYARAADCYLEFSPLNNQFGGSPSVPYMLRRLFRIFGGRDQVDLPFQPAAGQLLSVRTDEGDYAVMKLLAVDGTGVHARLFVQRFSSRPKASTLPDLTLAPFGHGHNNPFSIGHMPLSLRSFLGWQPEVIGEQPVANGELDGYQEWRDAKGGYF